MGEVAPRAGAWIETGNLRRNGLMGEVAPRAGAWIETGMNVVTIFDGILSPPARGRGLKPC